MDTKKILIIVAVILGAVVVFGAISLMGTDVPAPQIEEPESGVEIVDEFEFDEYYEEYEEVVEEEMEEVVEEEMEEGEVEINWED